MMSRRTLIPENFVEILIYLLVFQLILVGTLILVMFIAALWIHRQENKRMKEKRTIAQAILDYMKGKIPLEEVLKKEKHSSKILLLQGLEEFNQRFNGEAWEKVRNQIADEYLLETARENVKNKDWVKRAFSAHCFSMHPLEEDKEAILSLMDDPVFLVRGNVISAILQLDIKEGIIKMLQHMNQEKGYGHYFYRDALLSGKSIKDLEWIEKIAETTADEVLHLACLEILSGKVININHPFLLRDLNSPNEKIRLAALKVFSRNPQKESLSVLLRFVNDPKEEIREEAYRGLEHFRSPQTLVALENGLRDPSWIARTRAAESLKNMGKLGKEILEKQDPNIDKNAYEVAHYILQLDW